MSDQSITDILSGADAPASAPERITDDGENRIGTELVGDQPHKDEVEPKEAPPPAEGAPPKEQKTVPLEALHEERGKVKRYTEEVVEMRRAMAQQAAETAQLRSMLQQRQEQKPPPDIFDNAPEAIRNTVAPQFNELSQVLMANAQIVAGVKYGDDKVSEAEQAFIQAMQSGSLDPADYHKVVGSPNRYAAAVQWHQRQIIDKEIGGDPVAYRAKLEAEILAQHGLAPNAPAAQQRAPVAPAVMPSNLADARNAGTRNGTGWAGPPSIGDVLASARQPKATIFK